MHRSHVATGLTRSGAAAFAPPTSSLRDQAGGALCEKPGDIGLAELSVRRSASVWSLVLVRWEEFTMISRASSNEQPSVAITMPSATSIMGRVWSARLSPSTSRRRWSNSCFAPCGSRETTASRSWSSLEFVDRNRQTARCRRLLLRPPDHALRWTALSRWGTAGGTGTGHVPCLLVPGGHVVRALGLGAATVPVLVVQHVPLLLVLLVARLAHGPALTATHHGRAGQHEETTEQGEPHSAAEPVAVARDRQTAFSLPLSHHPKDGEPEGDDSGGEDQQS